MNDAPHAAEVVWEGRTRQAPLTRGVAHVGPFTIRMTGEAEGAVGLRVGWLVENGGTHDLSTWAVRLVWSLEGAPEPVRMFCNGYQSWSRASVATFGADLDPSVAPNSIRATRDVYLGDPERVEGDELRSELVTVLDDAEGSTWLAGFVAGDRHDGTFRLRRGPAGLELVAEAYLGGAVIPAGTDRPLTDVVVRRGGEANQLLEQWAAEVGRTAGARVGAPFQIGWCSWYHYFDLVTEEQLRSNLALAAPWPFTVFQLDDGWQPEVGDWLATNDKFPSDLATLADAIARHGFRPGIWLAPFLVAPGSEVARAHPDWLVGDARSDAPLATWLNGAWGGVMWGLDTTHPDVDEHLESVAATLVEAGFTYLKLDFTFSPGMIGRYADPTATPAERVRRGYDAIRRGAGDDVFLLGCGAPLGPCVGVVDGMRIGADVAPWWRHDAKLELPGLVDVLPATLNAYRNTLTRAFMHRRLWLNDPDCLMLRAEQTAMSPDAVRTWAHTVGVSGGMALVSDDLSLLGDDARALFDEVVHMGRESDGEACAGRGARCPDLFDEPTPRRLEAAGYRLETDPDSGRSTCTRE